MYIWDLMITQPEGTFYVFSAENEGGCSFTVEAGDIGPGTHRIVNLTYPLKNIKKGVVFLLRRSLLPMRQP